MSSFRLLSLLFNPAIRLSQRVSDDNILSSCSFFTVQHFDPHKITERTLIRKILL